MAEPQMVDPHEVVMTGENSFVRLSNDGGKDVRGPHEPLARAVVARRTGTRAVHRKPARRARRRASMPTTRASPAISSARSRCMLHKPFCRRDRCRSWTRSSSAPATRLSTVEERIVSARDEIMLTWWDLMTPFILTMPPGAGSRPHGRLQHLPARPLRAAVGERRSRHGESGAAGPLRQAGVELLPGVVGVLDEAEGLNGGADTTAQILRPARSSKPLYRRNG